MKANDDGREPQKQSRDKFSLEIVPTKLVPLTEVALFHAVPAD